MKCSKDIEIFFVTKMEEKETMVEEEGRSNHPKEIVEKKKGKRVVRINVEGGEEKLKEKMKKWEE